MEMGGIQVTGQRRAEGCPAAPEHFGPKVSGITSAHNKVYLPFGESHGHSCFLLSHVRAPLSSGSSSSLHLYLLTHHLSPVLVDMSLSKLREIVERQGSLVYCRSWGCKESDTT